MSTNLHAIRDSHGRLLNQFDTAGQVSDHIRARVRCSSLPGLFGIAASTLVGSRKH